MSSFEVGIERALAAFAGANHFGDLIPEWPGETFGVVVRSTRHFLAGDIVVAGFYNGQADRAVVFGWSSKYRANVTELFMQYLRHRYRQPQKTTERVYRTVSGEWLNRPDLHQKFDNRVPLVTVGLREDFTTPVSLNAPEVRESALELLRAAFSARRVGTGSPALVT